MNVEKYVAEVARRLHLQIAVEAENGTYAVAVEDTGVYSCASEAELVAFLDGLSTGYDEGWLPQ